MNYTDWLFFTITVSRRLTNAYYLVMLIISIIAIYLAYKMRFKRFSFFLWLISGLICLLWESYLFLTGARNYNFAALPELLYHALTEAGPGLIIMILFAHKIKLIDITEYSDDRPKLKPRKTVKTKIGTTKAPRVKIVDEDEQIDTQESDKSEHDTDEELEE